MHMRTAASLGVAGAPTLFPALSFADGMNYKLTLSVYVCVCVLGNMFTAKERKESKTTTTCICCSLSPCFSFAKVFGRFMPAVIYIRHLSAPVMRCASAWHALGNVNNVELDYSAPVHAAKKKMEGFA